MLHHSYNLHCKIIIAFGIYYSFNYAFRFFFKFYYFNSEKSFNLNDFGKIQNFSIEIQYLKKKLILDSKYKIMRMKMNLNTYYV